MSEGVDPVQFQRVPPSLPQFLAKFGQEPRKRYNVSMASRAEQRRARAVVRVIRPGEAGSQDDAWDRSFWQRIPAGERFAEAWRLSLEQWKLANPGKRDERRLSRSVARVRRG